jgi:ferrochelatase
LNPDSPDGWSARQTFNGELPGRGIKKVAVVSPAFASDCLETLEEIDVGNREMFEHAGGERFTYIPASTTTTTTLPSSRGWRSTSCRGWL